MDLNINFNQKGSKVNKKNKGVRWKRRKQNWVDQNEWKQSVRKEKGKWHIIWTSIWNEIKIKLKIKKGLNSTLWREQRPNWNSPLLYVFFRKRLGGLN